MDPNYLKYLSSMGIDPSYYIEMQANYLRMLATCYSPANKPISNPPVQQDQPAKAVREEVKVEENQSINQSYREESPLIRNYKNEHDEIPVKSLIMSFEKLLEEEIRKSGNTEDKLASSNSKHTFLKRKSQKVMPKKETTPNIASPKSKLSGLRKADPVKIESNDIEENSDPDDLKNEEKLQRSSTAKALPVDSQISDSPKPKQEFLKRGAGKLCVQKRASSLAKLERSKTPIKEAETSVKEESSIQEPVQYVPEVKSKSYLKYKKLSKELEEKKLKLEKDALDFYKMRENEVKSLEFWKAEELKKINEEKKNIEKQSNIKAADIFETENLKREIKQLRTTLTKNEEKYNKTIENLKEIIETLTLRNQELAKILQDRTYEIPETEEKVAKNTENPVKMKPGQNKTGKEETPKFKKQEKTAPTFSFKLPDKREEKKPQDLPPVIEIKLDDIKPESIQEIVEENKTKTIFNDAKREIFFSNGVKKEIFPDGYIIVHFNNKDRKETFPDGKIIYHFFENQTTQTTFPDGLQLFQFSNGQTEKHFVDGSKEIKFADGTVKCIFIDGNEESIFPDGTVQKVDRNGIRVIEFGNGMTDTLMPDGSKIRVYPDGRVKKMGPDGRNID